MPNLLRSHSYAAAENPLTMVAWDAAYWAEDPAWTNPGNGGQVSSWRNGGSNNWGAATQATASKRPLFRSSVAGLNGKPAIEWDNTDDFLRTSAGTYTVTTTHTVVIGNAGATNGEFFNGVTSGRRRRMTRVNPGTEWAVSAFGGSTHTVAGANGTAHCFFARFTATSLGLVVDGTDTGTTTGVANEGVDGFTIGAAFNEASTLGGHIAFIGHSAAALTGTEETNLLAWSRSYYGTP